MNQASTPVLKRLLLFGILSVIAPGVVAGATIYWDGTSTDWSSVTSWSTNVGAAIPNPAAVPSVDDVAAFSINIVNTPQTVNLNGDQAVLGLRFLGTNTATTTLLAGGTNRNIDLGTEGITVNAGAGAVTIGSATAGQNVVLSLQGSESFRNDSVNALTINNAVTLDLPGAQTLTLTGTSTAANTIAGVLSNGAGTMGLDKTGAGTWRLGAANTYTGQTNVFAGTLAYGIANAISTGGVTIDGQTAILDLGTFSDSVGTVILNDGGRIIGTGAATLTSTAAFDLRSGSVSVILAGGVALNKTTTGTVTLSGVNTYTGLTTISAGTLAYGVNNAIAAGGVTVDGSTAALNIGSFSDTVGAVILNNGGSITGTTGILTSTAAYDMRSGSVSAILAGAVALNKTTTGNVTMASASTYTGVTTLTAGTLAVAAPETPGVSGPLGNPAVPAGSIVLGGGTLQYTAANTFDYSARFSTAAGQAYNVDSNNQNVTWAAALTSTTGTLTKTGAGTLTLSNAGNTYAGLTTVAGGILAYGINNAISSGGVTVNGPTAALNIGTFTDSVGTVILDGGGSITGTTGVLTSTAAFDVRSGSSSAILGGTLGLNKTTAGKVTLSGASTYTGTTTLSAGILNLGSAEAVGVSGPLGTSAAVNPGSIVLSGGTLQYSAANQNDYSGRFSTAAGQAYNVDTNGQNVTWATALTSSTGTLTKSGAGTLTLSSAAANTFAGTTTVAGGTLKLDYTGGNTSKLSDTAALTLAGGTLELAAGAHTEIVSATSLAAGTSSTVTRSSVNSVLQMNAISRGAGAFVKFNAASIATTDTTNTNGILGTWATVTVGGVTNWATNSTNGADGPITALATYVDVNRLGGSIANTATNNVRIIDGGAGGNIGLAASPLTQINSLNMNANAGPATIAFASATDVFMIGGNTGGGILQGPSSGALTIGVDGTLGVLTTGGTANATPATLDFINENPANALTIISVIADNGTDVVSVAKSGTGLLALTGPNTYTGATAVSAGTINLGVAEIVNTSGPLGKSLAANAGSILMGGGTLQYSVVNQNDYSGRFSTAAGQIYAVDTNGQNVTWATALTSVGGTLTKGGLGALTLSGANTFTGGVNLNAGTLNISNATALGATTGTFVINGGAIDNTSGVALANAGNNPVTINGNFTFIGGRGTTHDVNLGAGPVTLGTAAGTSRTITSNQGTLTLAGVISNGSTATNLIKAGLGALTLSGANTFTGGVTLNAGTLNINHISALGTTAGTFTINGGIIDNTSGGAITTSNYPLSINGDFGFNGGAGTTHDLNFGTGAVTLGTAAGASRTINTDGGLLTLGGTIANGTTANSIVKTGPGVLAFGGTNSYTGTTSVNGGTLRLNYAANNTTKLSDTSALILGGGTIDLSGGTHTETVLSTTLTSGTSSTVTRSSGGSVLQMNTITPGAGAFVKFSAASIATSDNLNNSGGILGGWATINGTDWAVTAAAGADNPITALSAYTDVFRLGPNSIANTATNNVRIINGGTSGNILLAGGALTQINSLNMTASLGGATIDPTTNSDRFMIGGETGGGILLTSTAGALTIGTAAGDGTLTTGGSATATAATLYFTNESAVNAITVNSIIANNGTVTPDPISLAKSGAGVLVIGAGSTANTYTGATIITQGTLRAGGAAGGQAFGSLSPVTLGSAPSTLLDLNGFSQTIGSLAGGGGTGGNVNLGAGTLTTGGDGTSTNFDGVITGTGGVTKTGGGVWILSGGNSYSGPTTISAGILQVASGSNVQVLSDRTAVTLANTAGTALDINAKSETIGSLAGGGTTGGNVTLGAGGSLTTGGLGTTTTYDGVISGTGTSSVTKTGTGTMTLTGVNTFGTLNLDGGGVTLNNAAGNAIADTTSVRINRAGATLTLSTNETIGSIGAVSDTLINLAGGTLTSSSPGLFSLSGTITADSPTITGISNTAGLVPGMFVAAAGIPVGAQIASVGVNSVTLTLNAAASGALPGVIYSVNYAATPNTTTVGSSRLVTLPSTAGLSEGMFVNGTGINAGTRIAQILSGTTLLIDQGALGTGTNPITFFGSDAIGGNLSGTGGFTKNGTGELRVTGSFSQSGAFTINDGPLSTATTQPDSSLLIGTTLKPGNVLSDAATLVVGTPAGARTIDFTQNDTNLAGFERIGALSGGNANTTLNLLNRASVTVLALGTNNAATSWNGVIAGDNTGAWVLKEGTGKFTLTRSQTNDGVWFVDNGVLAEGVADAIDDLSIVWTSNRTAAGFEVNFADTVSGLLGGGKGATRSFGLNGAAVGFLNGNYISGTGGGAVLNATLTLRNDVAANTYVYGGVLSGAGGLTKEGASTLELRGANTYTGITTIKELATDNTTGVLRLGVYGAGSGLGAPTTGGQGSLSSATTVSMTSANTNRNTLFDLNGGAQTVNALTSAGLGSSTVNLGGGSITITTNTGASGIFKGVITGTGNVNVTKTDVTGWSLDSANKFTGTLNVTGTGTKVILNNFLTGGALADTASISVGPGAKVVVNKNDVVGSISGGGTIDIDPGDTGEMLRVAAGRNGAISGSAFSGSLTSAGGSAIFQLSGGGLRMAGNNTGYAGAFIIGGSTFDAGTGTLILDYSSGATDIVPNGAFGTDGIVLGGGTLWLKGPYTLDSTLKTTFNAGASMIAAYDASRLELGDLVRTDAGGTLHVVGGAASTSVLNTASGIIGGYATFGSGTTLYQGTTWAVSNGAGVAVSGLPAGSYTTSTGIANWGAGLHYNATINDSETGNVDTVRFNTFAPITLTVTGVSSVDSGGILVTPLVGPNLSTITAPTASDTLTSGTNDLVIHQYNSLGALLLNIEIADGFGPPVGLTKSGQGTLILGKDNTFTGQLTIGAGRLVIGNGGTTGTVGVGSLNIINNGVLSANRSNAVDISNAIDGPGWVRQEGSGILTLSATNSSLTGRVSVGAGRTLIVGASSLSPSGQLGGLGSAAGFTSVDAGGILVLGAATPTLNLSETIVLKGATLKENATFGAQLTGAILLVGQNNTMATTVVGEEMRLQGLVLGTPDSSALAGRQPANVVIAGPGLVTFENPANTYPGTTTINSGARLQLGNNTAGSLGRGAITDDGSLVLNVNDAHFVLANSISGSGGLVQNRNTVYLTGDNTYTGTTLVTPRAGENITTELRVGLDTYTGSLGTGAITLNGGTFLGTSGAANLRYHLNNDYTLNNVINLNPNTDGTNAKNTTLLRQGLGSMTLTGTVNIGSTSAAPGTQRAILQTEGGARLNFNATFNGGATNLMNIVNNGTIVFGGTASNTFDGVLSGNSVWVFNNSGTTTLKGVNTFNTGNTYIRKGTVVLDNAAGTAMQDDNDTHVFSGATLKTNFTETIGQLYTQRGSTVNIGTGTILTVDDGGAQLVAGAITGSGGLTLALGNYMAMYGTNTMTGAVLLNNGTIQSPNLTNALGTAASITLGSSTNGGNIEYIGKGETFARNLSLGGTVSNRITANGSGALILSGSLTSTATNTLQLTGQTGGYYNPIKNQVTGAVTEGANVLSLAMPATANDDRVGVTGRWALTNKNNDFSGGITVNVGILEFGGVLNDGGAGQGGLGNGAGATSSMGDLTATRTIDLGTANFDGRRYDGGGGGDQIGAAGAGTITNTLTPNSGSTGTILFNDPNAGTATLGANISFTQSFSNVTNPGAGQIINDGTKVIVINGNLTSGAEGARSWILDGSNTGANAINGVISNGSGTAIVSIIKEGAGTWLLNNAANTFTGNVTVTNGILQVSGGGVISDAALVAVNGAGADGIFSGTARFQVVGSEAIGTLTGNIKTSVVIDPGQTLTVLGGSSTFNGIIGGSGSLTRTVTGATAGTLTTTDKNTYTGVTTIGAVGTATASAGLTVYHLANGLTPSGLGASGPAVANLVFVSNTAANQGGILSWQGFTSQSTDRLFTIGLGSLAARINAIGTVIGTTAPALNFSNTGAIAMAGSGTRTLTLGGATISDNNFRPQITDGGGATTLSKVDAGLWLLNPDVGGNTYTGGTSITGGTLAIQAGNALGTGAITINGAAGVGLELRGGVTLANAINVATTAEGGILARSGTNLLTGLVTASVNVRVGVDAGASIEINNATSALTGSGLLTKFGGGSLILSGVNNATGATTVRGGTLVLDYLTNGGSKLADGAVLTLGGAGALTGVGVDDNVAGLTNVVGTTGGTIQLKGGSHVEIVSATTLAQGANAITQNGGGSTINLNAITRAVGSGATIDFGAASIATTDNFNGTGGIMSNTGSGAGTATGAYATVGKTNWAVSAASGADIPITALATYGADVYTAGTNTNVTIAAATTGASTTNTLRFNATQATTLTLTGLLQLQSAGVLVTPSVGAFTTTITGSPIQNAATTSNLEALIIHQHNTAGALQINSVIQNNTNIQGLTKSGAGKVFLNALNTQTGAFNLNEGEVQVGGTAAAPTTATAARLGGVDVVVNMSAGTILRFLSTETTVQNLATVQGGGTIMLAAGNTMPVRMDTDNSNFVGDIVVSGGTLEIQGNNNALGSNRGITTINSGGTLMFNDSRTTAEYIYMNDGAVLTTLPAAVGVLSGPQFLQNTTPAGVTYNIPAPVATGAVGLNVTGIIYGTNGFTKTGAGIMQISANNFTDVIDGFTGANKTASLLGQIKVDQGILYAGGTRAFGATGAGNETVVATAATLDLRGQSLNYGDDSDLSREIVKISGVGVNGTGALRNTTGTGQFSGLVLDANATVSGGGFVNGSRLDLSTYDTNINNASGLPGNFTRTQPTLAGNGRELIVLGSTTSANLVMHETNITSALNSITVKEGVMRIEQDVGPNTAWTGVKVGDVTNGITIAYGGQSLADQINPALGFGPVIGARLNFFRNSDIHHTVNITMDGVTAAANGGYNYIDIGSDTIPGVRTYLDGNLALTGASARNIIQTEAGGNISVVEQGNLTAGLRAKLIVGGQITGTGGFTKTGFSELRLTNDETFTGALNVLRFGTSAAPWQSNTVQINGVNYQTFGDAEGWAEWGVTLNGTGAGDTGKLSGVTTINLQRRGMITLDNTTRLDATSGVTGGNDNDRINNGATLNLSDSWLRINGGTVDNAEALATTGGAKVNVQSGTNILDLYPTDGAGRNMTLTIGEITRAQGGVLRIQNLDATSTFSTAAVGESVRVALTSIGTLSQMGGGGAAGSTNRNVVIGLLGGTIPLGLDTDLRLLGFNNGNVTDLYNQQRNLQFLSGSHFMTYDGGFLRPLDDSEYFTPSNGLLSSTSGAGQNVNLNDVATIVYGDTAINALRFGPAADNNGSGGTVQTGTTLTSLTDHHLISLFVDGTLSVTSGMLSSAYFTIGNSSDLRTIIFGGNLDFGTREAVINNQNGMYNMTNGTISTGNLEIRSNILGSGGLLKTGLAQVVLDGQNAYSGLTSISDGTLFLRNGRTALGIGGAGNGVYISGNGNLNSGNGIQVGTAAAREDIYVGPLNGDQQIMRVDNDLTNWFSNVTIDNVDVAGLPLGTPRIRTDNAATSIINGNIFGGSTPISNDVLQIDSRIVQFDSAGNNVFILRGQFGDKSDGSGNAIPIANPISTLPTQAGVRTNENEVLRVTFAGGSDETNFILDRQYNAAGRLTLARGTTIINYNPAGGGLDGSGFWTSTALSRIPNADSSTTSFAINGGTSQEGFVLGTTGNTFNALFLARAGQTFNMASWSTVGSGAKIIGGLNDSGTVTYGNGSGSLAIAGASSQLYAASGGTVVFNQRMSGNVGTAPANIGFIKIGRGTVELQNTSLATASDSNFELAGGTLLLNYDGQNVARVGATNSIFSGGTLRVQANTTAGSTASISTTDVANNLVEFRSGGNEIIAEARSGQNMSLNIGNANANASVTNLLRNPGATANFVEWSNGSGTPEILLNYNSTALATTPRNSVIAWATYGTAPRTATDFVMVDGGASNQVKGYVRTAAEEQNDVTLWSTIGTNPNVSENGGGGFRGTLATETVNSLHFDAPADGRIDISGTLTITSGGIMVASGVGAANKSITGGNITAGAGAGSEFVVHQYGTGNLTIDSDISGPSSLTITGPSTTNPANFNTTGAVVLVGGNLYTGKTVVNGAVLSIATEASLGAAPAVNVADQLTLNGGTLRFTGGNETMAQNRGVTIGGNGGVIEVVNPDSNLFIQSGITSAGTFRGDLIKTGFGTLTLEADSANQAGFQGLIDVREGTLRVAGEDSTLNNASTTKTMFGTSLSMADGTMFRNGTDLILQMGFGDPNTNNNVEWLMDEWFTFEGNNRVTVGITGLQYLRLTDSTLQSANKTVNLNGPIQLNGAVTFDTVGAQIVRLNNGSGYLSGSGDIIKEGTGRVEFRANTPDWTGSLVINQGDVYALNQADVLGTGYLTGKTITIGSSQEQGSARFLLQNPDQIQNWNVEISHDISVTYNPAQNKTLAVETVANGNKISFNGSLTLNDNLLIYMNDGAEVGGSQNYINFNGQIKDGALTSGNITFFGDDTGGANDNTSGRTVNYAVLNNDNHFWTGDVNIAGHTTYDQDQTTVVRFGNNLALTAANDVTMNFNSIIQTGGFNVGIGSLITNGGTGPFNGSANTMSASVNGSTEIIENAASTPGTLTINQTTPVTAEVAWDAKFRDGTLNSQFFAPGTNTNQPSAALNLVKAGNGWATLTLDNDYTGTTLVTGGILQVGRNGVGDTGGPTAAGLTVNSGATLAGTGVVEGTAVLQTGALLKPGYDGGASMGTLTFAGNTTLQTGTITTLQAQRASYNNTGYVGYTAGGSYTTWINGIPTDLYSSALSDPLLPDQHDSVSVLGTMTWGAGTKVVLSNSGYNPAAGDIFDLFDWFSVVGAINVGTSLRTGLETGTDLDLFELGGDYRWDTSLFNSQGILVVSLPGIVPEPGRVMLLLVSLMGVCFRRRRPCA